MTTYNTAGQNQFLSTTERDSEAGDLQPGLHCISNLTYKRSTTTLRPRFS